ncbi:unnamed protein product (macronuclear) [Paramecium tetraurelia]|uniref:Uncharacterized protein n=1 Tax=Paramecium tetraurelia TaxID=5888 RepID=A0E6L1_PARTE|nr:uncharacterized protein GSPATT00003793001 [Paramecium tetraurelia]CAK90928.1 unnamed protein product [Paramecium tetraurelia]|eukprot:XP_001458325.1 hypothetical protein (macronuclear) [Paramecium tetraurelia strain d4-2]
MNSQLQYEHNSLNQDFRHQINLLSTDLDHLLSLTKIRGQDIPYPRICQNCKYPHDYDSHHNLVIKSYTEAQFISDLIAEHDTLFQICNWAHESVKQQNVREQDKVWSNIISNNFDQIQNSLADDEKCILNSLRPFGAGKNQFDFMRLSTFQSENWVLALETLNNFSSRASHNKIKLFKWATCQSDSWSTNISKFNETLWLNIRADLFYKVMTAHAEIYPKMMKCINFGINKPYVWQPKRYELNCNDMNFGIETLGKLFIIEIINYLTQKSKASKLIQLVEEAIDLLVSKRMNPQYTIIRANCFYKIALMLNDLLDINEDDEYQFLILITKIIQNIETEIFDLPTKYQFLIHLLSLLTRLSTFNEFIQQICQNILNQLGSSLSSILQLLIDNKFNNVLITTITFARFTALSPMQQNELISSSFSQYFDYNEKKKQIWLFLPYIIENIDLFKNTFIQLLQEYPDLEEQENQYFQIYINKEIERMQILIKDLTIPVYWFTKYITFILEDPNLNQKDILNIMDGIQINNLLFDGLENKKYILALIAKKLTEFKQFINYLLK